MRGISIIICCYNSASRLPQTIKHIAAQQVPEAISWEIILVNNASTDNTTEVAVNEWQKYNKTIPFTVTEQPIPGLTAAREKGIQEARFDYLLFCDDDNWLNADYVKIAFECMEERKDAAIIGGQSEGFFEIEKPFWFDKFSQSYVVEKPLYKSDYLPEGRDYLAGAGMIIRKSMIEFLKSLNYKPILTDRIGSSLMSGGDYELCLIAGFSGFRIYFDERLKLTHFMPAGRLNWDYCLQMTSKGHAIPEIYFDTYKALFSEKTDSFPISFNKHFRNLLFKFIYEILKPNGLTLKNVLILPFRFIYFIKKIQGSTEQRRLLSAKNKLVFLLKNKKLFKQQFSEMQELLIKIKKYREAQAIHHSNET